LPLLLPLLLPLPQHQLLMPPLLLLKFKKLSKLMMVLLKKLPSQKSQKMKLKLPLKLRKFLRLKMKNLKKMPTKLDKKLIPQMPQKLLHLLHQYWIKTVKKLNHHHSPQVSKLETLLLEPLL